MTKIARELLGRALELSDAERARLARRLLESLDEEESGPGELDPVLARELERRLADEPAPGERWPTIGEVLGRLRRELKLPRAAKRRRGS